MNHSVLWYTPTDIENFFGKMYSLDPSDQPSLAQVRDFFCQDQRKSKEDVIDALRGMDSAIYRLSINRLCVVGGWYGMTAKMLSTTCFQSTKIDTIDLDPTCSALAEAFTRSTGTVTAITADMLQWDYRPYQIIINTSSEHLSHADLSAWMGRIQHQIIDDCLLIIQSNDKYGIDGHVGCFDTLDDFKNFICQTSNSEILYTHVLPFDDGTHRFTVGVRVTP